MGKVSRWYPRRGWYVRRVLNSYPIWHIRTRCCSDLRKCNARVEERRLIARNDRALYLELVVAVVILLSPLVVIQYNKQKSCYFVPTISLVPENTCV